VIVGYLMITALSEYEERAEPGREGATIRRAVAGIDFNDLAIGVSAFLAIIIMPFTYSITNGIGAGFVSYVFIKLARGKGREVTPMMYIAAAAFVIYFAIFYVSEYLT
jgi:AGZA family xanthine/uracil permease-like MFS transporter